MSPLIRRRGLLLVISRLILTRWISHLFCITPEGRQWSSAFPLAKTSARCADSSHSLSLYIYTHSITTITTTASAAAAPAAALEPLPPPPLPAPPRRLLLWLLLLPVLLWYCTDISIIYTYIYMNYTSRLLLFIYI